MSTKTSIKRIALVAVSALGFGLLSLVPARADISAIEVTSSASVVRAADHDTITLTVALTDDGADADNIVGLALTSAPQSATLVELDGQAGVTIGGDFLEATGLDSADADGVGAADDDANYTDAEIYLLDDGGGAALVVDDAEIAADGSYTLTISADSLRVPGDYTFTAFSIETDGTDEDLGVADADESDTVTVKVLPRSVTTSGTATLSLLADQTAYRSAEEDIVLTAVRPASGIGSATTEPIVMVIRQSQDTTLPVGTVIRFEETGVGAEAQVAWAPGGTAAWDATTAGVLTLEEESITGVGTYSYVFWSDNDEDLIYDSGEAFGTGSFTIGGDPASLAMTLTPSTIEPGVDGVTSGEVCVVVTDEDGNPTRLVGETIDLSESTATEATVEASLAANEDVDNVLGQETNRYCGDLSDLDDLTTSLTIDAEWSEDADVTTSATLTRFAAVSASALQVTSTTGLDYTVADTILDADDTTGAITIDPAVQTIYFKATTATAATRVRVFVEATGTTDATKVSSAATRFLLTTAEKTVAFPVAFTGAVDDDTFRVTVEAGATDFIYNITYADPIPSWSVLPGATIKAKYGDSFDFVATLENQYGVAQASKTATVTVAGRNPQTVAKTTDAQGEITFSITDASTSTTVLTDTITISYTYTSAAGTAATASATISITYSATGVAVGSVAVTPASTANVNIDTTQDGGEVATASTVVYTATVKDANGVAVTSGVPVTFSGGTDDMFVDGVKTGVTNSSGQATVTVYRNKVGYAVITATANAKSGTSVPVKWVNAIGDARYVSVSVDPSTIVSEGTLTVKATVTDRWGNGVEGATVTFSEIGAGRLNDTSEATNSSGIAQVDFTSSKNETGSNTITATYAAGQTINLAGFVGAVAVAGVTAGVSSSSAEVTITKDTSVSTADALLELAKAIGTGKDVESAADAALEAIDAANAATDAANLAAEAADAATVAAEEARDAADAATAAVEELATQVATLMSALKAQLTTLSNTVAKIAKKVKA